MEYDFKNQVLLLMAEKEWPEMLQEEMNEEWVLGTPSDESVYFIQSLTLKSPNPVKVKLAHLLMEKENLGTIARAPQNVIDVVNDRWDLNVEIGEQFEFKNLNRYFEYAKMPAETAKPSIMINGVIEMGCGRFIAALIRGDEYIYVWDLSEVR